jgi:hypothetical protein
VLLSGGGWLRSPVFLLHNPCAEADQIAATRTFDFAMAVYTPTRSYRLSYGVLLLCTARHSSVYVLIVVDLRNAPLEALNIAQLGQYAIWISKDPMTPARHFIMVIRSR